MIRRMFRFGLLLGLFGGAAFLLVKVFGARPEPDAPAAGPAAPWPRLVTEPSAATEKAPTKKEAPVQAWVSSNGGVCPTSHPVKAKLASKIFHLPGMLNYERTNPDRCYVDAEKAEADGLRAAKR